MPGHGARQCDASAPGSTCRPAKWRGRARRLRWLRSGYWFPENAYPRELSGGEGRCASIARALVTRAQGAADGRVVRRARRDHALQAQQRPARAWAAREADGGVRDALGSRARSSAAHRRDGGATRQDYRGHRRRCALAAACRVSDLADLTSTAAAPGGALERAMAHG